MRRLALVLVLIPLAAAPAAHAETRRPFAITPYGFARDYTAADRLLVFAGGQALSRRTGTLAGGGVRITGGLGSSGWLAWNAAGEYGWGPGRDVFGDTGLGFGTATVAIRARGYAIAAGVDARAPIGRMGVTLGPAAFLESAQVDEDFSDGTRTNGPRFRVWGGEMRLGLECPLAARLAISTEIAERFGWGSASNGGAELRQLVDETGMRLGLEVLP